jgi:hypothetical protein
VRSSAMIRLMGCVLRAGSAGRGDVGHVTADSMRGKSGTAARGLDEFVGRHLFARRNEYPARCLDTRRAERMRNIPQWWAGFQESPALTLERFQG